MSVPFVNKAVARRRPSDTIDFQIRMMKQLLLQFPRFLVNSTASKLSQLSLFHLIIPCGQIPIYERRMSSQVAYLKGAESKIGSWHCAPCWAAFRRHQVRLSLDSYVI